MTNDACTPPMLCPEILASVQVERDFEIVTARGLRVKRLLKGDRNRERRRYPPWATDLTAKRRSNHHRENVGVA